METDLHVKPTSKHQYLHTKSCHPKHCKTAIPYSQALRIKRICSERENLSLRTEQLKYHLSRRGYSEQLLDSEINRAINTSTDSSSSRSNRRKFKSRTSSGNVPSKFTKARKDHQTLPPYPTGLGPTSTGISIITHHCLPSTEKPARSIGTRRYISQYK